MVGATVTVMVEATGSVMVTTTVEIEMVMVAVVVVFVTGGIVIGVIVRRRVRVPLVIAAVETGVSVVPGVHVRQGERMGRREADQGEWKCLLKIQTMKWKW